MNRWFHKGNSRRFFRIDMPVRLFIAPSSPIKDREIFATGIDYFPPTIKRLIERQKNETLYWINRIQDQKEIISALFQETIEAIEFFGKCAESVSKGINPKIDPTYWMQINQRLTGFQTIETLKASSPKTYGYFKLIEEKYLLFLQSIADSISNSTPTEFKANANLPYGFKIDETLELFKSEKFAKIPLIQAILALSTFMDTYVEAYRQINDDNIMRQFPQEWKLQHANVSASGIALLMNKRFKNFEKVDVFFYFPAQNVTLSFNGSIVDVRSIDDQYKERIAVNFEFPDGKTQDFLQNEIQRYELEECMSLTL